MSKLVQALTKEQTKIRTENGAKTFSSSLNACLDLFFMGGAFRNRSDKDIISLVSKAYQENAKLTLQLLAYIRDCRGGMGERRFFKVAINHLANQADFNVAMIPEYGRWDDLFVLFNTDKEEEALHEISKGIFTPKETNGLCAKWMPRKGDLANKLRSYLGLKPKEYRKRLVNLTKVVETQMCNKEWAGINYSHVPSVANVKYNKAFLRNDETRRREFLSKAVKGEVKINSSVSFPHDIVKMMVDVSGSSWGGSAYYKNGYVSPKKNDTAEAMWKQLPDYLTNKEVNILPVCDTSGSMCTANGLPLLISLSLGLYISERNNGLFKDAYFTFSDKPTLVHTKGSLYERLCQMPAIHPANTNLELTFRTLLDIAIKNKLSNKDMPTHLLIISDMEFDTACRRPDKTLYRSIKQLYKIYGYNMPNIIFWNVNSRQDNVPVRFNQDGVGLVSGASPAVIQAVLSGDINPVDIMMRAVDVDRYKQFIQ